MTYIVFRYAVLDLNTLRRANKNALWIKSKHGIDTEASQSLLHATIHQNYQRQQENIHFDKNSDVSRIAENNLLFFCDPSNRWVMTTEKKERDNTTKDD